MAIQPSTIKTVYLYIFSGIGLLLILFGAYNGILFTVKSTQFSEYPLNRYEEGQCPYGMPPVPSMAQPMEKQGITISATNESEINKQYEESYKRFKQECEETTKRKREISKVQDMTHSIAALLLGVLVFIPHWKLARKSV
jgi:hypothetical protein